MFSENNTPQLFLGWAIVVCIAAPESFGNARR
jgi:hypothetical protein